MARGKKYGDEIKEKAIAMHMTGDSLSQISKKMGIALTTIRGWIVQNQKNIEDLESGKIDERSEVGKKTKEFVKVRTKNIEQFIDDAWDISLMANKIAKRRLKRALGREDEIDTMLIMAAKALSPIEAKQLGKKIAKNIAHIRLDDIGKLATVSGTMFDKQRLANGESTSNVDVTVKKLEDFAE